MNRFISHVKSPKTIELADRVRKLEKEGEKIIKFQTGDPDFKTHKTVSSALESSCLNGETHYINSRGLPELREAISRTIKEDYNLHIDPNQHILITAGGVQSIFLSLMALINPSDEVILFEPYYPQYEYIAKLMGGVVKIVPPVFNSNSFGYSLDLEYLRKCIGNKTKAVILNSPNNPSGKVYNKKEIEDILNIICNSRAYIITDEVYFRVIDEKIKHVSLLQYSDLFDRIIYINSFSKTYAMTGWRLGYVVSQKQVIDQIAKLIQLNITCVPAFIQRGGVAALESQEASNYVRWMNSEYDKRRKKIYYMIKDTPLFKIYPEGAFYYLLHLPFIKDIDDFAFKLLETEKVAVVPAYVYGDGFKDFVRISFSIDESSIEEGITRIINFYNRVV